MKRPELLYFHHSSQAQCRKKLEPICLIWTCVCVHLSQCTCVYELVVEYSWPRCVKWVMGTPPPTHWGLWVGRSALVCVYVCVVCVDGVRTLGQCPDYTQISFGNSSLLLLSFTPPQLGLPPLFLFSLCSSFSLSIPLFLALAQYLYFFVFLW